MTASVARILMRGLAVVRLSRNETRVKMRATGSLIAFADRGLSVIIDIEHKVDAWISDFRQELCV